MSFSTTSAGAAMEGSDQQQSETDVGGVGAMAGGKQKWTLLQNEQTSQESTELN